MNPVLEQTIISYLNDHKRLVIPQLGALLVKEPGHTILLSEMLKRDDAILRGLLVAKGLSEIEAAGAIDRLVFEVRFAVGHGNTHEIPGVGTFSPGPNGTIRFAQTTAPVPAVTPEPAAAPAKEAKKAEATEVSDAATPATPATPPSDAEIAREEIRSLVRPHRRRQDRPTPMQPDPSVRGLRYGKPQHTTDDYTYVGSLRRRPDKFVILALVAALIALGVILYGYLRQHRIDTLERTYIEQSYAPQPAEAAGTTPGTAPET